MRNASRYRTSAGTTSGITPCQRSSRRGRHSHTGENRRHSDPNVTLKVYGHRMKASLAEAASLHDPLREPTV